MRNEPLLQYYCSSCGKILSESSTQIQKEQLKEECPSCGALLSNTLQNMKLSSPLSQLQQSVTSDPIHQPIEHLSVEFQTAYRQIQDLGIRFAFDIEKIDLLLDLKATGTLCIIGDQKYTQILTDRLCVHSMLPKRYGGIGSDYTKIIVIDAGNCSNVYQFVDFARQYGLEIKNVMRGIVVSRVFTIYQLADLLIHELPKIIHQYSSRNKLIVIYGLLHLFVFDPHTDKADASQLIKEIARSLKKLSRDRLVLVSFDHSTNNEYERSLLPVFDKRIEITDDVDNNRILQINVNNQLCKRKVLSSWVTLRKETLMLVPSR
jgi:DNA-directed RNA polymerase subunit RPC12/RpoP